MDDGRRRGHPVGVASHLADEMEHQERDHRDQDPLRPRQAKRLRFVPANELHEKSKDPRSDEVHLHGIAGDAHLVAIPQDDGDRDEIERDYS